MSLDKEFRIVGCLDSHFDNVVQLSDGIYEGQDYLPLVFHPWVKEER